MEDPPAGSTGCDGPDTHRSCVVVGCVQVSKKAVELFGSGPPAKTGTDYLSEETLERAKKGSFVEKVRTRSQQAGRQAGMRTYGCQGARADAMVCCCCGASSDQAEAGLQRHVDRGARAGRAAQVRQVHLVSQQQQHRHGERGSWSRACLPADASPAPRGDQGGAGAGHDRPEAQVRRALPPPEEDARTLHDEVGRAGCQQ